jgi:hypothetical protein
MKRASIWVGTLGLWAACAGVACGPRNTATFDNYGYKNDRYGYRLLAESGDLMGPSWKLDNLYKDPSGKLKPKKVPEYLTQFDLDVDGDGDTDSIKDEFLFDLRFKHLQRDATIWLRTFPISDDLRGKDLRVLVQRYVDEVSGAGFEAVQLGPQTTILREKRFAAQAINRGQLTIAGQPAYETTFDVANVDEVAINKTARKTRVRIVLVRTPFEYQAGPTAKPGAKFAVLMLAGYANLPEDFDKDLPDFERLLNRVQIGTEVRATPVVLDPVSGAETPAAAATPVAAAPATAPAPSAASAEAPPAPRPSATPAP